MSLGTLIPFIAMLIPCIFAAGLAFLDSGLRFKYSLDETFDLEIRRGMRRFQDVGFALTIVLGTCSLLCIFYTPYFFADGAESLAVAELSSITLTFQSILAVAGSIISGFLMMLFLSTVEVAHERLHSGKIKESSNPATMKDTPVQSSEHATANREWLETLQTKKEL